MKLQVQGRTAYAYTGGKTFDVLLTSAYHLNDILVLLLAWE